MRHLLPAPSPRSVLLLPLVLLCACAHAQPPAATRIEGEPEYAAQVRAALLQQEEGIRRCTNWITITRNHLEASMTSATIVVAEGSAAFEKQSAASDMGSFENCISTVVLKGWTPPPSPPGRVAAVNFHFQGRDVGEDPAATGRSLVYNMRGAWLWLDVVELDRAALQPPVADFDPKRMQPPVLVSQGSGGRIPPEVTARVAGQTAISKCVITLEGKVERCRVIQSVPEVDASLLQILQGQRYRPAVHDGSAVPVDYTFKVTFKSPVASQQP